MKIKSLVAFGALVVFSSIYLYAADHIEAPGVSGTTSDITDYYAFESPESSSNIVLVANLQGLLSPSATASAKFDENVMVEFNIDTNDDKALLSLRQMVLKHLLGQGMILSLWTFLNLEKF